MLENTSPGVQGQPSWIREVLRWTICQMSLLLKVGYPMLAYDGGCPRFIGCSPQGEDGRGVNILSGWLRFITQTEDFDPHLVDSLIVLLIDLESLVTENSSVNPVGEEPPAWSGSGLTVVFFMGGAPSLDPPDVWRDRFLRTRSDLDEDS